MAHGTPADAVLWENVGAKIADQGFVSWGLVALFALAGVIASVGILIDSAPIVVGAMAVSPDFGPIAAFSVGVVRRRRDYVVRGFGGGDDRLHRRDPARVRCRPCSCAASASRRTSSAAIGNSMAEAIAAPDGFSVVVALCAGAAGMLSVTLGKSAALVGVAISITTIPAAADIGVSLAYDDRVSFRGSALPARAEHHQPARRRDAHARDPARDLRAPAPPVTAWRWASSRSATRSRRWARTGRRRVRHRARRRGRAHTAEPSDAHTSSFV